MTARLSNTACAVKEPEIKDRVCIGHDAFRHTNKDVSLNGVFGKVVDVEMMGGRRTGAYTIEYVINKVAMTDRFWRNQFTLRPC